MAPRLGHRLHDDQIDRRRQRPAQPAGRTLERRLAAQRLRRDPLQHDTAEARRVSSSRRSPTKGTDVSSQINSIRGRPAGLVATRQRRAPCPARLPARHISTSWCRVHETPCRDAAPHWVSIGPAVRTVRLDPHGRMAADAARINCATSAPDHSDETSRSCERDSAMMRSRICSSNSRAGEPASPSRGSSTG